MSVRLSSEGAVKDWGFIASVPEVSLYPSPHRAKDQTFEEQLPVAPLEEGDPHE